MDDGYDIARYERERQRLIDAHAYDPASERDACGVGLVCAIDGKPRREVVQLAIRDGRDAADSIHSYLRAKADSPALVAAE